MISRMVWFAILVTIPLGVFIMIVDRGVVAIKADIADSAER